MAGEGIVAAGVCGQGCFPGARGSAPAGQARPFPALGITRPVVLSTGGSLSLTVTTKSVSATGH